MIFRAKRRAKLLCALGALLLLICAAVLWLLVSSELPGNQIAFRLDCLRQIKNGSTNILLFRLTSLDPKHFYALLTPGAISTPLPPTGFTPSVVFQEALPSPVYGPWTLMSLPAATWATNFVPTAFRSQVEFAMVAPTNDVWRLNVQITRHVPRVEAFTRKTQRAWDSLKSRNFSALPGAWSGPWSWTLNYSTWSAPFTNKPGLDEQMTRVPP